MELYDDLLEFSWKEIIELSKNIKKQNNKNSRKQDRTRFQESLGQILDRISALNSREEALL